jgi:hypothetical protein
VFVTDMKGVCCSICCQSMRIELRRQIGGILEEGRQDHPRQVEWGSVPLPAVNDRISNGIGY